MSQYSSAIQKEFPNQRLYYLKPRDLDEAIIMVEENLDESKDFRLIYDKYRVMGILAKKLKWPINKIGNYLVVARAWSRATHRAPVILTEEELQQIIDAEDR